MISGSEDQTVRLWEMAERQELHRFHFRGGVATISVDAEGQPVLVGPEKGAPRLYKAPQK